MPLVSGVLFFSILIIPALDGHFELFPLLHAKNYAGLGPSIEITGRRLPSSSETKLSAGWCEKFSYTEPARIPLKADHGVPSLTPGVKTLHSAHCLQGPIGTLPQLMPRTHPGR